ncbi:MAG: hypothetical protein AB8G11_20350 [Saprospiraceae bacterium]
MYRFYLIILLIIITTVNVFAQKTIDRATYENAVDHLNCELGKFYMLEEQGKYVQDEYLTYSSTHPCSYENLMVFIQGKQPQLENNGYLATYIESFKKEFDEQITNGALYNKLMEIFKQDLLLEYEGQEDYEALKFALKEDYLKEKLRIHELQTIDGVKDTKEESFDWSWFRGTNLLLLIFGIFILFFAITILRWAIKYGNTGKRLSKKDLAENRVKPQIPTDTSTNIPTQTINEKFKPKSLNPRTPKKKTLEKQVEAVMEEVQKEEEIEEVEPEEFAFYMPYPSIDGSFYDLERSETEIGGQSTFKFKLVNEKYALATFEILSNDKIITDIFMDYERTIKSACELENKPKSLNKVIRPGITKIITIEPGTVQKTAQHWRLKKKAVIRFEYE